jgi:hypothetical protein
LVLRNEEKVRRWQIQKETYRANRQAKLARLQPSRLLFEARS